MTNAIVQTRSGELQPDPVDAEQNRMTACFSYLYVLGLIPLIVGRESPFVRYHLNQGLALLVLALLMFPLVCLNFVFMLIPVLGVLLSIGVMFVHAGTLISLTAIGIYNASSKQMKPLPIIGGIFTFLPTQPPPRV